MSENYAPTTNVAPTSPVTILNDGDSVTYASLMTGIIKPIWDGIFYLANHIGSAALTELLAGGPYAWAGDQEWAGVQTYNGDNVHNGIETFLGEASFAEEVTFSGEAITLRQNVGLVNIGTIAANTQIDNTVGIVYVNQPSTNTTYNIALPAPASRPALPAPSSRPALPAPGSRPGMPTTGKMGLAAETGTGETGAAETDGGGDFAEKGRDALIEVGKKGLAAVGKESAQEIAQKAEAGLSEAGRMNPVAMVASESLQGAKRNLKDVQALWNQGKYEEAVTLATENPLYFGSHIAKVQNWLTAKLKKL